MSECVHDTLEISCCPDVPFSFPSWGWTNWAELRLGKLLQEYNLKRKVFLKEIKHQSKTNDRHLEESPTLQNTESNVILSERWGSESSCEFIITDSHQWNWWFLKHCCWITTIFKKYFIWFSTLCFITCFMLYKSPKKICMIDWICLTTIFNKSEENGDRIILWDLCK